MKELENIQKADDGFKEELSDNRNPTGNFTERYFRSFIALFRKNRNIYKLFFAITKKLGRLFSISTAVFVVHSAVDNHLKVIAIKRPNYTGEGLALTLPEKDSLLYSVFKRGTIYTENCLTGHAGNFIEKKLFPEDQTKSLAVCPIKFDGSVSGLLCFASPSAFAFENLEDSLADEMMRQLGTVVGMEKARLDI
jgi:hypothetical protein